MFFKWQPIYSVNVKEIDEQHKKIFKIINRVQEIKKDFSKEDKMKVISELKEYGEYHLNTEEKFFKKFDYPDKDFHVTQHNEYRKKIKEFEEMCAKSDEPKKIGELSNFLKDWWLNHIQNTDQQYSDYFNQKGLY